MKILVIHATAGAGHKKAAEAIYNGLLRHTTHQVQLVDSLDYTNSFFKAMYPKTYVFLVTKLPVVWQFAFWLLDLPFLQPLAGWLRRCYNAFNTSGLVTFLEKEKFDVIITTHFMSAEISAYLKRKGHIRSKIICVVTDFDVHHIWVNKGTDLYVAATDYTKEKIIQLGVPAEKVFVTGIPTDEKFSEELNKSEIRKILKLEPDTFTVLIATGSFGLGPMEELIHALKGYQIMIVCGHNRLLYERLKAQQSSKVHIFGLVNNMHELMSAADVMITKPGGLSISEALVKRLPLIFFSAIPGQEMNNIKVLKKYGVASDQGGMVDIIEKVDDYSFSPDLLGSVRQRIGLLSKPNAVKDIIKLIE